MGTKYMINAFNYPYSGLENSKQCKTVVGCLFWFVILAIKYDGVDVQKRD